jgi:alpha-amylase
MKPSSYAAITWALAGLAQCLSPADWRKQSIYQVMTDRFARTDLSTTATCDTSQAVYCGGTYKGLISKLDYIQGMGFTAIWISPMTKQMNGQTSDGYGIPSSIMTLAASSQTDKLTTSSSYHGYWAEDIWSVNSAFGTADDLVALSDALHARGMVYSKVLPPS